MSLPTSARTVIIGGGVIGSSIAYHLSKFQKTLGDIVLLEAQKITSGTTWHAAGLVGSTRNTSAESKLSIYGTQLYATLLDETGLDPGYKKTGSVNVARCNDRLHNFHRTANKVKSFGLHAEILTPDQVHEKFTSPKDGVCAVNCDDLTGGIWIPSDGAGSPTDLTNALLRGARNNNAQVFEDKRVAAFGMSLDHSAVKSVTLESGETIHADTVIIAAGQWSRQLAAKANVDVPLHSAEHFYATTQNAMPGVWNYMPVCRDPDALIYFREWGNQLLFGGFEEKSKPWGAVATGGVPENFEFALLEDDYDHFMPLYEGAVERLPSLETAEIKLLNGPESFTPDGNYILGEAPNVNGLYVCAGMNSSGIASAGGAGRALADWITHGEPQMELGAIDIRRFHSSAINPSYLKERVIETLGLHYTMPYPRKELKTCRGLRQSALYDKLDRKNAVWGQRYGWERPVYFKLSADEPASELTYGRPGWLPNVIEEVNAVRNGVGIFDISSFAKIAVSGPNATAFMNEVCGGQMDVPVGKLVYTPMLNKRGGYEADVTVTRVSHDAYFIVTATAQATKDVHRLKRHASNNGGGVTVTDVTGQYTVLSVMGPKARYLLQSVSCSSFSSEDFPFGESRDVDLGLFNVTAKRVTYVGELGWELYVPVESSRGVYDTLHEASDEGNFGLRDAGYYAIEAMRLEKGYKALGHELDSQITPKMAGLGFAVDKSKNAFVGSEKWADERGERLFNFKTGGGEEESDLMLWGGEILTVDGEVAGELMSATYSPTLDCGIGMGFLKHTQCYEKGWIKKMSDQGRLGLLVGEREVRVEARLGCWFDAKSERVKA
jgi:4-methylaminobutanoate oxidase (formaldehyde-forming)